MRRLIRLCTAGIKSIPRWIPPAIALAGVGLGTAICASPPPESMPNSYQPLVNLDPIKHDGNQLQVPLKTRETHLKEIENTQEYDIIIIGGGCTGAGVFLEGASRGLKCLLLESEDYAASTSSKSTKLIHGGIRYLYDVFDFSTASLSSRQEKYELVKEALTERTHFVENAFYMNKSLPFVVPSTNIFTNCYYYIGCLVYHWIYSFNAPNSSYTFKTPVWVGGRQLREYFPYLDEKYNSGVIYYDGQFNDARMNVDLLLTASIDNYAQNFQSGNLLNYAKVTSLLKDSQTNKINGVSFKDLVSNKTVNIKSKIVVNCAGSFSDEIRYMDNPKAQQRIVPVSGSHLSMPLRFCSKKHALLIPETEDGRILFLVPWLQHTIVGTTERKLDEPTLNPTVSVDEMLFMSTELSKIYTKVPSLDITSNIQSKWSGVRPLILENANEGEELNTKKLARKHVIEISNNGLISTMGGKWTIYRLMGEETIDTVLEQLKKNKGQLPPGAEVKKTLNLRLLGEANKQENYKFPPRVVYVKIYSHALADKYGIDYKIAKNLIRTYGMRAFDILQQAQQSPNSTYLLERLHENHPFLKAEILYHIRQEMAQFPIDVLFRRTRLAFLDRKAAFESLKTVCDIFGKEKGWNAEKIQQVFEDQREYMRKLDF